MRSTDDREDAELPTKVSYGAKLGFLGYPIKGLNININNYDDLLEASLKLRKYVLTHNQFKIFRIRSFVRTDERSS